MAHEANHWDFYLNEAGYLQQDPKRQLSREEMFAIAEKQGYATSRKIRENLGHNDPLEGFASIIRDRRPRNATEVLRLVDERMKDPKDFDVALAVFAITTAFGKKDKLVTKKELEAYKLLGAVES